MSVRGSAGLRAENATLTEVSFDGRAIQCTKLKFNKSWLSATLFCSDIEYRLTLSAHDAVEIAFFIKFLLEARTVIDVCWDVRNQPDARRSTLRVQRSLHDDSHTMIKKRLPRTNRPGLPRRVGVDVPRSPLKAGSTTLPLDFLDETITFWQPRAQRTLTREDAREIVENLTGFFGVLREWQEAERLADKGVTAPVAPTEQPTRKSRDRKTRARVIGVNI